MALSAFLAFSAQAELAVETIIEEDDARITYTGNWVHKTHANAHDGQYVAGKASAVDPAEPGSIYIDLSDAVPEKSYWIEIGTLRHTADWRSVDVKVLIYTANGVTEGSYSQVGGIYEVYVVSLGGIEGLEGIEISNATSDDRHVVFDYALVRDIGYPSSPGPVYESKGNFIPSGPMGTTFVGDASITELPIVIQSAADKVNFGRDVVMLDDKDGNGIKEFITQGSIGRSSSSPLLLDEYGTRMFIVSTNSDGTVKSYQPIGYKAVKNTGFEIDSGNYSYSYLKPVGDFDGNGTTDVLLVGQSFHILLLDDNEADGYSVIGTVKVSNAVGNLPESMPGGLLFNESQTEAYADVDANGVMDFITVIRGSANKQYVYAREQLGYTLVRDVTVLVLMNIDGTVKELKHFQDSVTTGVYRVAGDVDGDGVVDLMHSSPVDGGYEIALMNSDFTIKAVKTFTVTKNGTPFGNGRLGYMIPAGDVDGNGIGDVLIAAYSSLGGNVFNSSLELVLLHENASGDYAVLSQQEIVHADDYMTNQYNNMGGALTNSVGATLADMDGDGDLDALINHNTIGIHIRFFE